MIPRFDSVCPIRAVSFSNRKWHAMAISQPPPRAWPLIAAITGFGKRSILRITLLPKRMKARSEERRVGKEWRCRGGPWHGRKKKARHAVVVRVLLAH